MSCTAQTAEESTTVATQEVEQEESLVEETEASTEDATEVTYEVESIAVDKALVKVQTAKAGADSTEWMDALVQNNAAGGISITLASVLPMYRGMTVSATMTNKSTGAVMASDTVMSAGTYNADIFIGGLESGSHTLRLKAAGFMDYVQDVEVNGNILYAYIGTGMVNLDGVSYETGKTHP